MPDENERRLTEAVRSLEDWRRKSPQEIADYLNMQGFRHEGNGSFRSGDQHFRESSASALLCIVHIRDEARQRAIDILNQPPVAAELEPPKVQKKLPPKRNMPPADSLPTEPKPFEPLTVQRIIK